MDAAGLHKTPRLTQAGELVLQNSKQAGTRRPLGVPTTFVGRAQGCDIRLNVDGVDPMHCVLVVSDAGVQLRDLNSREGTWINEERTDSVYLSHGDLLKVGPFQFRVELPPVEERQSPSDALSIEQHREAIRIQTAAVAAQQVALDEEETRLQTRRAELQHQEEQLAAHLAEKQRQVKIRSDQIQAEREALRKEKIDHEKYLAKLEAEYAHARQELHRDHQKLDQQRQRINAVYQRLRKRWKQQWSTEKEKHQKHARKLLVEARALKEQEELLRVRETAMAEELARVNSEWDVAKRQLADAQSALKKEQHAWRTRRSLERQALKAKARETAEAHGLLQQARQLIVGEKATWEAQLDALKHELHGLNNRIVHQRVRAQEQEQEIARLDAMVLERKSELGLAPKDMSAPLECEVEVVSSEDGNPEASKVQERLARLDRLASELADQRMHLVEQYALLAKTHESWQQEHNQAACQLEALATRLADQERFLADREARSDLAEALVEQRRQETESIRQDIVAARAEMTARAEKMEQEFAERVAAIKHKESLLAEQLTGLAHLRQRWTRRRQDEAEELHALRAQLAQQQKETHDLRVKLFQKGQEIEHEKRILAEKSLALEQYRNEVFGRAKDPTAVRRVERLRRRWLMLNAALIRNAKNERQASEDDLAKLDGERVYLAEKLNELVQRQLTLAEQQAKVEERESHLQARQMFLDQEFGRYQNESQKSEKKHLRLQAESETIAGAVFAESENAAIDKAA